MARLVVPAVGERRIVSLFGSAATALVVGRGVHLGALTGVLADRYGQRPAVEDPGATPGLHAGGVRSFRALEDAVGRLAAAHRHFGAAAGERVLIVVDNRIDVVLHMFALARLGALPVPVNARLSGPELTAVARATGAARAVGDDEVLPTLAAAGVPTVSTAEGGDLARWLVAHPGASEPPCTRDPAATALYLTTSGTTGSPKAAGLTSRGLLNSVGRLVALPVGGMLRHDRDQVLAALPLTHVMGLSVVLACLCAGVPLLHRPRFDANEVLDLIEHRAPNVFVGVPTMYADLEAAGAADRDLASVQLWISAADTMPTDRARRFQRLGAVARLSGRRVGSAAFVDVYGMVELSGAAAARVFPPSPVGWVPTPPVAATLPGVEARTVDDEGMPVGRGRVGHVEFRGAGVLTAYADREGEVADPEQGWFRTGDQGRLWPGGWLSLVGRGHDRLKVGGFSVFPAELEEELRDAPGVADVVVVGRADDRLGERPVAVVVPANASFDREAFLAWADQRIVGYRRPTDVVVVDQLPLAAHAKVDRRAARVLAEEALEHDPSRARGARGDGEVGRGEATGA